MNFKNIVAKLKDKGLTISTMESCTGGGVSNMITNIEGASEVLKFSVVTYSNEYKMKIGVSKEVIEKYSVYSMECADEMSLNICKFADSDIGVGVTGKLNRIDKANPYGEDNKVFISIYDKNNNVYVRDIVCATLDSRIDNKSLVIEKIILMLENMI